EPRVDAMALVAVGVSPLLAELRIEIVRVLVDRRVAERERIALVVVVGLVFGVGVVDLKPVVVGEAFGDAERPTPVLAVRGGLDRRQGAEPVRAVGADTGRPGGAELGGVAV